MNIISQFKQILETNFNNFLKNHFIDSNFWHKSSDFNNYINFMTNIDKFSSSFITDIIKAYFEYIDNIFFNSSYRKNFCDSKGFYQRTILTMFGEVTFKRRYYFDNKYNDYFFFTDFFLGIPKRKYFDPFICADICNEASSCSYSKAGKIIASKIGNRINNNISISRASSRNIVMNFNIDDNYDNNFKRVERLFVMLDEKFVASQFNNNQDHMIKASIIFEGHKRVYKSKAKPNSMDRYKLINSHACASIDNNLLIDTVDYIYSNYDVDYIKEIIFMGDCANWIKNFPRSHWFDFNTNIKVKFAMDGFHFSQALLNLTTEKYPDVYDALYDYVLQNNKSDFVRLVNEFIDLNPDRKDVIQSKMDYILNNWHARQLYQNNAYIRCSMESHISHFFADLFTSRPKAYSENGLKQLLKLRLLKVNSFDIKQIYLNSLFPKSTSNSVSYTNFFYDKYNKFIDENFTFSADYPYYFFDNYINIT